MKTPTEIASYMPERLSARPRDKRGLPIPFSVKMIDGLPDFRVSDARRWRLCVDHRQCALCGRGVSHSLWFVGGPSCERHRLFQDPGMHRTCAEFALRICPFLAMSKAHYSDLERRPPPPGTAMIAGTEDMARPDRFMLGAARNCHIVAVEGVPFIQATPWIALRWWKDGAVLSDPAIEQFRRAGLPGEKS
jgi:hypothetical protein